MTIEHEDLQKIAYLAKLQIDENQTERLTLDLSNILNLVDQLQSVDTSGINPMAHPMDAIQRLRPDEVTESNRRDRFQAVAPATENGLYLVPKVIE